MQLLRAIVSTWRLDGMHLLALLCPPLAVRACGRHDQIPLNALLTVLLWIPGVLHALWLVSIYQSNSRASRIVAALRSHIGH